MESPVVGRDFVGREQELQRIFTILGNPYGEKRTVYLEGIGGIGKTKLILLVLDILLRAKFANLRESEVYRYYGTVVDVHFNSKAEEFLVPYEVLMEQRRPLLIDFYSTDNRTVDGVREAIIRSLGEEHFAEFRQPKSDTPSVFRKCLQKLVTQSFVVLAFDTFELVHNDPLVNWLLDEGETGLQMPGLICLIGSRPVEQDKEISIEIDFRSRSIVEWIKLGGITHEDAVQFYCRRAGLDADSLSPEEKGFIKELVLKSEGNPLLIELIFDQSKTESEIWTEEYLKSIDLEELKKAIMQDVREKVTHSDQLNIQDRHLNIAAFDTLLCMSYLTRRFDADLLQRVVDLGFVKLGAEEGVQDIIETLRPLFFVKVRENDILQLHDEMARIVRQYLFVNFGDDLSGERRREFQQAIIELYDRLVLDEQKKAQSEEVKLKIAQLQAECLYYMLEYGVTILKDTNSREGLEKAYDYFVELQESGEERLDKLLPGEMLRVLDYYPEDLQYDIYQRLAKIQQELNNLGEAELYWAEAEKYANSPEQQIQTLLGWHNTVHPRDAQRSLNEILPRALELAEQNAPQLLSDVLYEFGFTYDRLQVKDEAIKFYREALQKYDELKLDNPVRRATILNDLGFALARQGEYEEGSESVGEGRDIRQSLYDDAIRELAHNSGALEHEKDEVSRVVLEKERNRAQAGLRRATLRLGLAHSTEAQISRYSNQMQNALRHYDDALKLFNQTGNDYWVALTHNRRGETLRRMAREQHEQKNFKRRDELFRQAQQAIDESIYLAEKYGLQSQSLEVFERRKGRLFHDEAIWAIEKGQKAKAAKLLEQARKQFETAIQSAERIRNSVEVLESEVELIFLQDDFVEVQGAEHDPEAVQEELVKFRKMLRNIKRGGEKIFQFQVYQYLWEIENGAYWHEVAQNTGNKKAYETALEHYVMGYVGMARLPGYGQYRFNKHLGHLKQHIEVIPNDKIAIGWCRRFLDELSQGTVKGSKKKTLAEEHSEFVSWLLEHISQRGGKL